MCLIVETGTNIASKGTASQSSTGYEAVPEQAIDGNADSDFFHDSCSHTRSNKDPWWKLTFNTPSVFVNEVVLVNGERHVGKLGYVSVSTHNLVNSNVQLLTKVACRMQKTVLSNYIHSNTGSI